MPAYNFYVPPKIIQSILAIPPADLVVQDFLKPYDGDSYLCPICENAVISTNLIGGAYVYHCDNCDDSFNNFRIFTDFFGKDFFELCKNICSCFNIKFNTSKKQDFINFDIQNARAGLNDCQKINFKGLTFETLSHFNCGFLHDWTPVKSRNSKNAANSPRIIVPSQNHYSAFPLSKNSPTLHEGAIFPFNFDSISADAVNIIVENEFDAMTIWQVTGGKFPVVAIFDYDNGAQVFFNELQRKFAQDVKPRFLIFLNRINRADLPRLIFKNN